MWTTIPYALLLTFVVVANLGVTRRAWRAVTYFGLAALNVFVLAVGLLIAIPPLFVPSSEASRIAFLGWAVLAGAVLGLTFMLLPSRRVVARFLNIDPSSPVHMCALVFMGYLMSTTVGVLFASQGLLSGIGIESVDAVALVAGEAFLALLALAGVGLGTRRGVSQTLTRLGLTRPTTRQFGISAVVIIALLVLDYATSWAWRLLWPANYESVAAASQQLFARFTSVPGALLLGVSAGVGEESLFRGALQPRFRIPLTAAVFALSHVQYSLSPAILEILVVGLVLGWMRERLGTTSCMVVHAGYNFLDVLIMPLLP